MVILFWVYARRKHNNIDSNQYQMFIWNGKKPIPPIYITKEEAKKEVAQLIYALENYIGYNFLKEAVQKAINKFKALQYDEKIAVTNWYKQLAHIKDIIPDQHAKALLNGVKSMNTYTNHNINQTQLPWLVVTKQLNGKKVLLIGIVRFPDPSSSEWKGFLTKVQSGLQEAEAVVLDLRGNTGGDDRMGRALANLLYNSRLWPYPVKKIVRLQHPIVHVIRANQEKHKIKKMQAKGLSADELVKNHTELIKKAKYHQPDSPIFETKYYEQQKLPKNIPNMPIFILIDRHTGSSGENMVDFLENHPHVIKIGEPTAGTIHFGNMGLFILPYSKIIIFLGTQYKVYYDQRMREGKGIPPDYHVPAEKIFVFLLQKIGNK